MRRRHRPSIPLPRVRPSDEFQLLEAEDAALLAEAMAGDADAQTIAAPSVVTRSGHPAHVELARSVPVDPSDGSPVTVIPVGFSMTVDPHPVGEQGVAIRGVIDISGLDPAGTTPDASDSPLVPVAEQDLDAHSTEFSSVLDPNQSAVVVAYDRPTDGKKVLVAITAMRITPAGEPIRKESGIE